MSETYRFQTPCKVGRLAHRRLLYVVAFVQSEGIDLTASVISKGLFDVDYMLTFVGTKAQAGIVDRALEMVAC